MNRLTEKEQALIDIGQGAIDWARDMKDDCHFCERDERGEHDDECPVGEYVRKHQ